jgi:hypothetical protein
MKYPVKIIIVFLLIYSCNKGVDDLVVNDNQLIIKYGTYGSWCTGDDSLIISSNNLRYGYYSPCDKKSIFKQSIISSEDKKQLVNTLNLIEFEKLELNSCAICVDGTDYWISIENGSYFHKIRYAAGDTLSINSIIEFVRLLDKQKAKFLK